MPAAKEHRLQDSRTNGLKTIISPDNGKTAADRQKSSFFDTGSDGYFFCTRKQSFLMETSDINMITITHYFQKQKKNSHAYNTSESRKIVKYVQKNYKIIVKNSPFTRIFFEGII